MQLPLSKISRTQKILTTDVLFCILSRQPNLLTHLASLPLPFRTNNEFSIDNRMRIVFDSWQEKWFTSKAEIINKLLDNLS